MSVSRILERYRNVVVVVVLAVILVSPVGYYAVLYASQKGPEPFLERPDQKYRSCVRETTYMRFRHMDLLKEIRDQVVREGIRGEVVFNNCKECHTNKARFCDQCHNAVSLQPDCFGCHYYPQSAPVTASQAR